MALIYCPECGHEISTAAIACPNCGRPISANSAAERHTAHKPHDEGVPKWVFIPLAAVGAVIVIALLVLFSRNSEDANANLRVGVNTQRPETLPINAPGTTAPMANSQVSVSGSQVGVDIPPAKGKVTIEAKIADRNGPQPVKNEKFYLLDKDLEAILQDASIEPIVNQTLLNSFGLSVVYPDRYGDFNRRALAAIRPHIKYAGTTDANGKATLGGIEPGGYYLFGVARSGNGFAIWSSPVSIIAGENALNLAPVSLTEIDLTSGD